MAERDDPALQRALLSGDPTTTRDLYNQFSGPLYVLLKHRYTALPQEAVKDAVHDALLALILHPERFDSKQGTLLNYLVRIGANKLSDQVRAYRRRSREVAMGGAVELEELEANAFSEGKGGRQDLLAEVPFLPPEVEALLETILPEPRDRRIWELICEGRTAVAEFAVVLEITHLSDEEQRREVKRHRDRVQKRVRRREEAFRRLLS